MKEHNETEIQFLYRLDKCNSEQLKMALNKFLESGKQLNKYLENERIIIYFISSNAVGNRFIEEYKDKCLSVGYHGNILTVIK